MRFDPFGWFTVRRLREARAESKAMAEDYRRNEAAPMSPERRKRLMEFRAQVPTCDGPDLQPLTHRAPKIVVASDDLDGGYIATMPDAPGIAGQGETQAGAFLDCVRTYQQWRRHEEDMR